MFKFVYCETEIFLAKPPCTRPSMSCSSDSPASGLTAQRRGPVRLHSVSPGAPSTGVPASTEASSELSTVSSATTVRGSTDVTAVGPAGSRSNVTGLGGLNKEKGVRITKYTVLISFCESLSGWFKIVKDVDDVDKDHWFTQRPVDGSKRTRATQGGLNIVGKRSRLEVQKNFFSQCVVEGWKSEQAVTRNLTGKVS